VNKIIWDISTCWAQRCNGNFLYHSRHLGVNFFDGLQMLLSALSVASAINDQTNSVDYDLTRLVSGIVVLFAAIKSDVADSTRIKTVHRIPSVSFPCWRACNASMDSATRLLHGTWWWRRQWWWWWWCEANIKEAHVGVTSRQRVTGAKPRYVAFVLSYS